MKTRIATAIYHTQTLPWRFLPTALLLGSLLLLGTGCTVPVLEHTREF